MNDNLIELAKKLLNKTKKRQINWSKASGEEQFSLILQDGSLTIENFEDQDGLNFRLVIYNDRGEEIERELVYLKKSKKEEFDLFNELSNEIKRSYYRAD